MASTTEIIANPDKEKTLRSSEIEDESLISQSWVVDPQNPTNWSPVRKWMIVALLVVTNFFAAICTSAFEPALPKMMADFHSDSGSLASLTISIYVVGYCLGPLIVAPLSELYGHAIVLWPAYILFMVGLAVCGSSKSLWLFIVFRTIMGFAAITFGLMGPAIVADLIPRERRGFALSIMSAGPVVAPTIGPLIGGYIVENTSWRWTFWSSLIAFGVLFLVSLAIVKETYNPVLLKRKQIKAEAKSSTNTKQINPARAEAQEALKAAWIRPFKILFRTPIVLFVASYSSLPNSYALITYATVGTVFQNNYSFTPGQSGLAYFGLAIGFIFSLLTLGRFSDQYMLKMEAKHGVKKPEYRLPPMFISAILLPIGFFWYGWSLEAHAHWIVPIMGSAVIAVGILGGYTPVQMYVVDAYGPVHAASALGACTIVRSIISAVVPLCANPLYDRLGYGWDNSIFAFIALGFIPIALLVFKYGEQIRTNPRFQPKL